MIWFSADCHLSHKNIIKYCNRPFKDVDEMDKTILNNFKRTIRPKDTLYFLGDLTFNKNAAYLFFAALTDVEIHFILGNHDSSKIRKIAEEYCQSVSRLKEIKIKGISITLCHYAMRVWNASHYNSWQLYGHSHGTLPPTGKQWDVGVDNHGFFPICFEELDEIMEQQPNNVNYLSPKKRR
ncbi:MAG: phosphoesterase [Candidatus Heimdallarchaeota archaeon]|nr:phosphoesterase [Candidatus Heimdallarchaeota archaeon]